MRPQTIDKYEYTLGEYAIPALGQRRLNELTPGICQSLIDSLVARGRPGKDDMTTTAVRVRSILNMVLDRAVIHDAIRDNPMRRTMAPTLKKPVPRAITVTCTGCARQFGAGSRRVRAGPVRPGVLTWQSLSTSCWVREPG